MLGKSINYALLLCWLLAWPAQSALADGESRQALPNEREFYVRVLDCFAKAHPAGPEGWDLVDQTEVVAPDYMGVGAEEAPLMVAYQVSWQDTPRLEEAQAKVISDGVEILKKQEDDQSSKKIQEQFEKLVAEMATAMEKGDYQRAQVLQRQAEEVSQRLDAVYAGRERQLRGVEEAYAPHDAKLEIILTANSFSESFARPAEPIETVEGLQVFRGEGEQDPHNGWQEGVTTIFIGDWRVIEEEGGVFMEAEPDSEAPYDAVQTVVVQVQADAKRAAEVVAAIDWVALKGLLQR